MTWREWFMWAFPDGRVEQLQPCTYAKDTYEPTCGIDGRGCLRCSAMEIPPDIAERLGVAKEVDGA